MQRHDLAWIDPQADFTALTPQAEARLRAWLQARLPVVIARRDPATDGDQLRLGVPLPLAEQRQRLALRAPRGAVLRHAPPPSLQAVLETCSGSWRAALHALHQHCSGRGLAPRVFGSHGWQAVTGREYVHPGSDLDLLWEVDDQHAATAICTLLQYWESVHRLRADGELRFAGGQAVNWREYASDAPRVLVKADAACWLATRDALGADACADRRQPA